MKYRQLTKEQFENLHEEFSRFLASQKIDSTEWTQLKKEKPAVAEEELNVFSDVVWDDVLTKVTFIEHFSKKTINIFKCDKEQMQRIVVQVDKEIDLLTEEGYKWLLENSKDASVDYFTGAKKYDKERNTELFDLIEKGGTISTGELFDFFSQLTS